MVNNTNNKKSSSNICFQCGSALIFVSEERVQPEGMRYAQINTVYRCSNVDCQNKKDKEKRDREKLRKTKEDTDNERKEKIQELRKLGRKSKIQEN